MDRRVFIAGTSMAGMGLVSSGKSLGATEKREREIAVFTKSFEKLSYDELANLIAPLGVAGIEAPLRKGGHIEPAELAEKLPTFVSALTKKQLKVVVMTSSINQVDKAGLTEKQLRAAAAAGIKKYRLAYLKYDLSKPLKPQITNFTAQLKDLAELNKELGIQGLYQNHRGQNNVGAPVWDIVGMLEEINLPELGIAFDFAHATVEGANAWQINFMRALPHIGAVYFKDYKVSGKKWQACPLGQGMVDPKAGKLVSKMLPKEIPISLHVEYMKGKNKELMIKAMGKDLTTLRNWL
jgi:sugar phosphate isomerase/epimerase